MGYEKIVRKTLLFDFKAKLKEISAKKDPNTLPYMGSQIYSGYQGQGKTLTMVRHGLKIRKKYPKAILVSNLQLNDIEYIHFNTFDELQHLFSTLRNGNHGVIYLIDEIHNYFHSHDSRSIPLWIVQVFSQQRKNRVLVLGTVQMWKDVTKSIRDQLESVVECTKFAGLIVNKVLDPRNMEKSYGVEKIKVKKIGFYIPTPADYNKYDTYQIINSGRSIFGSIEPISVQINNK